MHHSRDLCASFNCNLLPLSGVWKLVLQVGDRSPLEAVFFTAKLLFSLHHQASAGGGASNLRQRGENCAAELPSHGESIYHLWPHVDCKAAGKPIKSSQLSWLARQTAGQNLLRSPKSAKGRLAVGKHRPLVVLLVDLIGPEWASFVKICGRCCCCCWRIHQLH